MYNNPYARNMINQQSMYEQIDNEISNLQQMKERMKNNQVPQQQPSINQTFQLAPTNREVIRYANSIDDVQRDMVIGETPYFSKDMSVVWVKNVNGNIRTFELNEIIPKDAKDMQIEMLQAQIEELRKEVKNNATNITNVNAKQDTTNTTGDDETDGEPIESSQPTGIQRVSTSKKK